jgi:nucleoside-diphosphate-sugar epimerase
LNEKKFLITGGAVFIGSNLIRSLKQKDWEIIVIDSLIEQVHSTGKWEVPGRSINGSGFTQRGGSGKVLDPLPSMEDQPLSPASCYAITKHNQEELLSFFSYTFNVPAVALRFQNVYGPGQSLTNPYTGILSIFNTRISADNPVLIYEDGKETRDFVYIEDVVQSICLALENQKSFGVCSKN